MKYIGVLSILCASLSLFGGSQELELVEFREQGNSNGDVHGLLDVSIKNDYITPRGLLVTNTGVTFQVLGIFSWDLFKSPDCFIQKTTVHAGVWNDIWTEQADPYVGAWNELDWFAGITFEFADRWKFGVQVIPFISPPHNFRVEDNLEFLLAYDDSAWEFPVVINPYMKFFWAMSGDSTVVTGKRGGTWDIELGMIPTYSLDACNFPCKLMAPTWLTTGPASFWNGGPGAFKNEKTHLGVFSTGLRAECPLAAIPKRLGKWTAYLGGQYYHLINDNLLLAQTITLGIPYKRTHRDVGVAYAGIYYSF